MLRFHRMPKGSVEKAPGSDHMSNVVVMANGDQQATCMFDTTNPQPNERNEWQFGLFRMRPEDRLSDGHGYFEDSWMVNTMNGQRRKYQEYSGPTYWKIDRAASPTATISVVRRLLHS